MSPSAKAAGNSDATNDLKTLPLADVEKKLESSPNGIGQPVSGSHG
jgi:hypothetical protein